MSTRSKNYFENFRKIKISFLDDLGVLNNRHEHACLFEQLEKKRNHFKILSMDVSSTNFCGMKYLKNEISLICNQPCQIMDI